MDSSAIVKRYVEEPGSKDVREVYLKAYSGDLAISFSTWNIGEVLGVLDRARVTGRLGSDEYALARRRFLLDTRRLYRIGRLLLVPVKRRILIDSWGILERRHVYVADALQIATAKFVGATRFLTGDKEMHKVALDEGLNSTYLGP